MKLPVNLGYKIYFLLFGWMCFGELGVLLTPSADSYLYYHALQAFYPPAAALYFLAVLRGVVNIICLLPLFAYAFNKRKFWLKFFKIFLFTRIITDLTGHNYEWLTVKSLFYIKPFLPICSISVWLGMTFLSYKAHFLFVYRQPPAVKKT